MVKSIAVRRAPRSAYNPGRPVSDLLKAHIRNLEAIAAPSAAATRRRTPKTEAQASTYIAELTRQIPNLNVPADPAESDAAFAPDTTLAFAALARPARQSSAGQSRRKKKTAAAARASRRQPGARKKRAGTKRRKARKTPRRPTRY